MNNLLPLAAELTEEKLLRRGDAAAAKSWQPSRAEASEDEKHVPWGLASTFTKDDGRGVRFLKAEPLPIADPNSRDVRDHYNVEDPSPLCSTERGIVTETTKIALPKTSVLSFEGGGGSITAASPLRKTRPPASKEKDEVLEMQVTNLLEQCIEVYIQKSTSMQVSVLRPNMQCRRILSDTKKSVSSSDQITANGQSSTIPFSVLLGSVSKISTTITGRHEIKAFTFLPGPIGMEVEFMHSRLICSRVVPDSQAFQYENELTGAEVLSVNGARVISLEDFQHRVIAAYETGSVIIGVAAYRSDFRGKKDFAHFIGAAKIEFKSLLSNIMKTGIDKDHQHDIGAQSKDDDDDDSVSSSSSGSSSEESAPLARRGVRNGGVEDDEKFSEEKNISESKELDRASAKENQNQEKYEEKNDTADSESDQDDDKIISIRKTTMYKPNYAGVDNDVEQGMIVQGRRGRGDEEENDLDFDDFAIGEFEEQQHVVPEQTLEVLEDQEAADQAVITTADHHTKQAGDDAQERKDSTPAWDYTTALETEEALPFSVLVAVPAVFNGSLGWGDPQRCVQFTNYSTRWEAQICWIDEEAAIVPRTRLRAGQKHIELTSPKHIWVIIATSISTKHSGHGSLDNHHDNVTSDANAKGTALLLRPSATTLGTRRYTSAMWIPGQSITASQRLRAKTQPAHKLRSKHKPETSVLPNLLVTIMDGTGHF